MVPKESEEDKLEIKYIIDKKAYMNARKAEYT